MSLRKENYFRTQLFKPSKVRNLDGSARVREMSLSETAQDSYGVMSPTASFMFDPAGSGLKNTQQLNVDFSKFENHTFFNSARNKVQVAFDKIINTFPFDGTRAEHEIFFNDLTGFEKHVFDSFPKNVGFLIFTRSTGPVGNYLSVKDYQGVGEISSKEGSGAPVLDFKTGPFTVEFAVYVPSGSTNDNEVILQRLESSSKGFTIGLSSSAEKTSPEGRADLVFGLSDESKSISTSLDIAKGQFHHIAMVYDKGSMNRLNVYLNGQLSATSSQGSFGNYNFFGKNMLIGSGSDHIAPQFSFSPVFTLSGALDEVRYFLSNRNQSDIQKYMKRELYAQEDLALYFRFNEPSGSFDKGGVGNDSIALDHSGNGLHTRITNFQISCRNKSLVGENFSYNLTENPANSPVLFPSHEDVQSLASSLMSDAKEYDFNNPNMITKLVPRHYFDESAYFEGFKSSDGDLSLLPGVNEDLPGGNKLQQAQMISSVLFMWAEVFDDIKMFIDEASRLLKVDYVSDETISDHLIPFLANYQGFTLPSQFSDVTIDQYRSGKNLTVSELQDSVSLQTVQNTIWRRILADLPEIRRTKGTRSSFRAVLRNMGINPDGPFKIREYGGTKTSKIGDSYMNRKEVAAMMNFSGALSPQGTIDGEGKDSNRPLLFSSYLTASRIEPGWPHARGDIGSGGSSNINDKLLTSGSWAVEGTFKFDGRLNHNSKQSLLRIQTTGSEGSMGNNWSLFNVVARKADPKNRVTGSLTLFGAPNSGSSDPFTIYIPNVNVFDGDKWHVTFGRERHDKYPLLGHHSSSYFFRVGKQTPSTFFSTGSSIYYFDDEENPLNIITGSNNASGAFIAVGSMSLGYDTSSTIKHLNGSTLTDANTVDFSGKVSGIRFYTKALTEIESDAHTRNFKSIGVENPKVNFNFNTKETGSFERLRIDMSLDQLVTKSDAQGEISAFDFSQNLFHGSAVGFEPNAQVIVPETFEYVTFEPKFETSRNDNKVRIRSYKSVQKADKNNVAVAPVYEIPQGEEAVDDRRFEIEISSVQALNEDIMNIFATLDFFDNAIGDPELVFSAEYRDLRHLRQVYFNRLEDKVSIKKFFEFFKWFDMTVGDVFEELVPRTSRFLGTNFVIESHALERPKFRYSYTDMYLGEIDRRNAGLIFLQQLVGSIKKF